MAGAPYNEGWANPGVGAVGRTNFKHRIMGTGDQELRRFVTQSIFDGRKNQVDRIVRYQLYWNFYHGQHWKDYNDTLLVFNYIKAFIDKTISFLVSKETIAFQVKDLAKDRVIDKNNSDSSKEQLMVQNAEFSILRNWNKNNRRVFVNECLQMGSIMGDAWVLLAYIPDSNYVKYTLLDSRYCFPTFERGTRQEDDLKTFTVRTPMSPNDKEYILHIMEYTKTSIKSWYQKTAEEDADKFEVQTNTNKYGFIPIVHIRNRPNPSSYYSISDIRDLLTLNKVYNEMNQEMKSIIDYYATPTTVITGANAKSLKRGLGNIWSGLPAEAQVFNLTLDADLNASMDFTERIKTSMHEMGDVPENSLGKLQPVSNTSGAALELTYQPLVQRADEKKMMYGAAFTEINTMTFRMFKINQHSDGYFENLPVKFVETNSDYVIEPVFTYGFPSDRESELSLAQQELNMEIASRKEIMERLGKHNVPALIKEIDSDNEERGFSGKKEDSKNSINEPDDPTGKSKGADGPEPPKKPSGSENKES